MSKFINGDCLDAMKEYPDNYFGLAIVDPPYGIGADETQNKLSNKKGFTKNAGTYKKYHDTAWDKNVPSNEYFNELLRTTKNQIVWGGNYFYYLKLEGVIIWYKGGSGNFKEGEFAKTNINTFKIFKYSRSDAYINDIDIKVHPTQKPIKLYKWLLKNYAKEGDTILDTHVGSASSLIACEDMGFEYVGYEIDEDYYKAASKRLDTFLSQIRMF